MTNYFQERHSFYNMAIIGIAIYLLYPSGR